MWTSLDFLQQVRDLEQQLNQSTQRSILSVEDEMQSLGVIQRTTPTKKNLSYIRAIEKEKREAFEVHTTFNDCKRELNVNVFMWQSSLSAHVQRISAEYEAVLKDQEDMKKKLEASKARNISLSAETKTLKAQIYTLLEKGKHDDELVDALLVGNV